MPTPYESPTRAVAPSSTHQLVPFSFGRVLLFSAIIYFAVMVIGFASRLSMRFWEIYGSDIDSAMANALTVGQVAVFLAYVVLFWLLAAPVGRKLWSIASAAVIVLVIGIFVNYGVFQVPITELFEAGSLWRFLLAATIGWAAAHVSSNYSLKRTDQSLRD